MKKYMCLFLSMLMILSLVPMTVGAAGESWSSFVFTQDGPEFSFEATDFTGTGSYTFYAAAYGNNNELIDVKAASNLEASDGVLSATVDFEENGTKEADVNISYVKTMVWGDEYRPIVKSHTFDIEEQKIDPDTGIYNNLTNGFYKPVIDGTNVTIVQHRRLLWSDNSSANSGAWNVSPIRLCDSNPATEVADNGPINGAVRAQYVAIFKDQVNAANSEKQIDRVVAYLRSDNTASFYLTSSDDAEKYRTAGYAQNFNEVDLKTAMINVDFLGNKDTGYVSKTEVTIDDVSLNRLVFNTDFVSRVLVFDAVPADGDYYAVSEFLPYAKVKATYAVPEGETVAEWSSLSYTQDGPNFTLNAEDFVLNKNKELKLVVTAYDGAGSTGNVLATESETFKVTRNEIADLKKTVNIEKQGELSPKAASIKVEVVDEAGQNVITAWEKNITAQTVDANGVYNNLTNGLYEQIITPSTLNTASSIYRSLWSDLSKAGVAQTRNANDPRIHDNKITTDGFSSAQIPSSVLKFQYISYLTRPAQGTELYPNYQIDRVVAYLPSHNTASFYLGKNDNVAGQGTCLDYNNAGYAEIFKGNATDNYYKKYVGSTTDVVNIEKGVLCNEVVTGTNLRRLVFNTDYVGRMMIFDANSEEKGYYSLNEFQIYRKVQDSYVVSMAVVD